MIIPTSGTQNKIKHLDYILNQDDGTKEINSNKSTKSAANVSDESKFSHFWDLTDLRIAELLEIEAQKSLIWTNRTC